MSIPIFYVFARVWARSNKIVRVIWEGLLFNTLRNFQNVMVSPGFPFPIFEMKEETSVKEDNVQSYCPCSHKMKGM